MSRSRVSFFDGGTEDIDIRPRFYTFHKWPQKYFVRYLVLNTTKRDLSELDWEIYPKLDVMKQTIEIIKPIIDRGDPYG